MTCPICKKPVLLDASGARPFKPFCSKRCKMVDLGKWFGGDYAIAGPPVLDPNDVGAYGGGLAEAFDITFGDDPQLDEGDGIDDADLDVDLETGPDDLIGSH